MILAILAGVICFPILFAVSGAFMQQWELAENLSPVLASGDGMASWSLLPRAPSLASLVELLLDTPQFFVMFWNSLKLACCIVGGQLLVGVPAAWSLARFRFPGSRAVSMIYLVLMLMPFQVLMFPEYLVLNGMGLLDTHSAVILPAVFSTFPVFIIQRFFAAIPEEILEAARIDGAGELRLFFHIGVPLGASGIVSAGFLISGGLEYD